MWVLKASGGQILIRFRFYWLEFTAFAYLENISFHYLSRSVWISPHTPEFCKFPSIFYTILIYDSFNIFIIPSNILQEVYVTKKIYVIGEKYISKLQNNDPRSRFYVLTKKKTTKKKSANESLIFLSFWPIYNMRSISCHTCLLVNVFIST